MAASRKGAIDIVIADIFTDEIIQMPLAKHQKIVQAFLFDALNHSLAARIQFGALHRQDLNLYPFGFEHIVELCREFRVAIAHQAGRLVVAIRCVHQKVACLLRHPRQIGMRRGIGDEDLVGLDVDEDQQEIVHKTPRRDDVDLDELFRAGLNDADQPVDVLAKRLTEFQQPSTLLQLGVNFAGDAGAEV